MKIKEVTYTNKYVTGPYLNHQPGLVADLEEGEDPVEALIKLKAYCDAFDKLVNNFEQRLTSPAIQPERFDGSIPDDSQTDAGIEIAKEFEKAKADITAIEFKEDAIKYMNNNGWTFNIELKNIANSKPSKTP